MKTSKVLLFTAAVGLATALSAQANTLFFDLGSTNFQTTGLNYNNVFNPSQLSIANAIDSTGAGTGIGLSVTGFAPGVNTGGTTAPTGAASIFDAQATRDNLFGNTGDFSGIFPMGTVVFTGLDLSATYDFTFFASRLSVTDNRETLYSLTGANSLSAALDAANNTSSIASVTGMIPDGSGNITLDVTPGPNNNNSLGFFYLGAMQIVAVPEPSIMALATLGGFGLTLVRRRFRNRS